MTRSILLGLGSPQYGPVSSGNSQWYYAGISKTEYNPARARELLAQCGLKDTNQDGILEYGEKRRPLELSLFTSRGNNIREKAAQVIQDNLAKVGIRAGIQHLLPNEIASRFLGTFEYEAILFGFTPTDVDAGSADQPLVQQREYSFLAAESEKAGAGVGSDDRHADLKACQQHGRCRAESKF